MRKDHLASLHALRETFENEEDWVAVGHVSYLIDQLSVPRKCANAHLNARDLGATLH